MLWKYYHSYYTLFIGKNQDIDIFILERVWYMNNINIDNLI